MNISRLIEIQHAYHISHTPSAPFLAVVLAPCLWPPAQQCTRMCFSWSMSWVSWRYIFGRQVLQSKKLTRMRSELLSGQWCGFLLPRTLVRRKTGDTWMVNCCFWHRIVSLHLCKKYVTGMKFTMTTLLLIKSWTF